MMNKMFSFCTVADVTAGKHLTSSGTRVRTPNGFKAIGIHEALELRQGPKGSGWSRDRQAARGLTTPDKYVTASLRQRGSSAGAAGLPKHRRLQQRPGQAKLPDKNQRQIPTNCTSSGESKQY